MKPTRLIYIANSRIPTDKAHGIQIVKMCEAFAGAGLEVELLIPRRKNIISEDIFSYYPIKKSFSVRRLFTIDFVGKIPRLGFLLQSITFAYAVRKYLKQQPEAIVYSRDIFSLWAIRRLSRKGIYEIHDLPSKLTKRHRTLFRRLVFVAISNGLRKALLEMGIEDSRILVAPDGIDLELFRASATTEQARRQLNIPFGQKIVMYAGHLYRWKGVEILLEAARNSPEWFFYIIGGTASDVYKYGHLAAEGSNNIKFIGHRKYQEIPLYLQVADVLTLPNSGKQTVSRLYTSPLKLFEYLSTSKPILASDLPSIHEVADRFTGVFYFQADDPISLTTELQKLKYQMKYQRDLAPYSWINRAKNILTFVSQDL